MERRAHYVHLFFDLDRTLWDFERNSRDVLEELFQAYALEERGVEPFEAFLATYRSINADYWKAHRSGRVGKDELRYERFHHTLLQHGISDRYLADRLAEDYLRKTPGKILLIDGALETLAGLAPHYRLHLLTNGYADTQLQKLEGTGMESYLEEVITSDRAGTRKPDPGFFRYALEILGAEKGEALMIGDDVEADIIGARDHGIDQVLFDPDGSKEDPGAGHRVKELRELLKILLRDQEEKDGP
jgi:putative hydrolase of the HAD superfamily